MVEISEQEELFIKIGNLLEKKISVYAICGTAMMLRSIKNYTLDIDFVFDKKSDRDEFILTLKKMGFKESDVTLVYGLRNNFPINLTFFKNQCNIFYIFF